MPPRRQLSVATVRKRDMGPLDHCKYCGGSGALIRAHVIPEAFFRKLREGTQAPLLVTAKVGEFTKRVPIGVYDSEILCGQCEGKLLATDTYGIEVLLRKVDHFFLPVEGGMGYTGADVDKTLLLRFFIALLWRASVSLQPFFRRVNLGPYETEALHVLCTPQFGIPKTFDAVMSRWDEADYGGLPTTAILDPYPERWDNVKAYRVYLGRVVAYIKVDKQPFREPFSRLSLQAQGPCQVIARSFSQSKDLQAMKRTAVASARNRYTYRGGRGAA